MSKMKNFMMDIEEQIMDSIAMGAKNDTDVLEYVKTYIPVVDTDIINKITRNHLGDV